MKNTIKLILLLGVISISFLPYGIVHSNGTSMSPTIEQGDLFIIGPSGEVSEGDIVQFQSPQVDEPIVHRVVEVTDSGYITQGDNNTNTDQDEGFRTVTDNQIVGSVVSYNGQPVTVSGFGSIASIISENSVILSLGLMLILSLIIFIENEEKERGNTKLAEYMTPLFVIGFVTIVTFAVIGTATVPVSYVHQQNAPSDSIGFIETGESASETVVMQTNKPIYSSLYISSDDESVISIEEWNETDSGVEIELDVKQQESSGVYSANIYAHNYPSFLPITIVETIYGINNTLGIGLSVLSVMTPAFLMYLLFVDPNEVIRRNKNES